MLTYSTVYGSLTLAKQPTTTHCHNTVLKKVENSESFERCSSDCSNSAALIRSTGNLQPLFIKYILLSSFSISEHCRILI